MQPSIPPIGRCLTFSTSQVDLTHNDDYVVTIVNIINITSLQCSNDKNAVQWQVLMVAYSYLMNSWLTSSRSSREWGGTVLSRDGVKYFLLYLS